MSGSASDPDKMFKRLSDAERRKGKRATPKGNDEGLLPIVPIPSDVSDPDWRRLSTAGVQGAPDARWTYFTESGARAFHVVRWNPKDPNGRKIIRPVTWCRLRDGRVRWVFKAMPAPRPLFDLPDILEFTSRPVVVVEGEKCAEAAARVFPDYVVTTWAGGTNAWRESDWDPIVGRVVLLVADADKPGHKAMCKIAKHLESMGCTVRLFLPSYGTVAMTKATTLPTPWKRRARRSCAN